MKIKQLRAIFHLAYFLGLVGSSNSLINNLNP